MHPILAALLLILRDVYQKPVAGLAILLGEVFCWHSTNFRMIFLDTVK